MHLKFIQNQETTMMEGKLEESMFMIIKASIPAAALMPQWGRQRMRWSHGITDSMDTS